MSLSSRRVLLGTGSAALALALSVPAAALADPGHGNGGGQGHREPSPTASPTAAPQQSETPASAPSRAAKPARPKPSKAAPSKAAPSKGAKPSAAPAPAPSHGPHAARPTTGPTPPAARPTRGSDPRGNNGTIKVDGEAFDDGRGNEPHVGCRFAVDFYGFDAGQTADITFTGQAPTRTGTLLSQHAVPISDDAAGGGQDRDATLVYTAEQLGLSGVAPSRNGWHVRVAVDVLQAPGGAKQKVFWLQCAPAASTTAPAVAPVLPPTQAPTQPPTGGPAFGGGPGTVDVPAPSPSPTVRATGTGTQAAPGSSGSGGVALDASPAPTRRPLAAQGIGGRILGGALPFTGSPVGALAALGVGALAVGGATVVAARRRAADQI